jgi:hypothetical protein
MRAFCTIAYDGFFSNRPRSYDTLVGRGMRAGRCARGLVRQRRNSIVRDVTRTLMERTDMYVPPERETSAERRVLGHLEAEFR